MLIVYYLLLKRLNYKLKSVALVALVLASVLIIRPLYSTIEASTDTVSGSFHGALSGAGEIKCSADNNAVSGLIVVAVDGYNVQGTKYFTGDWSFRGDFMTTENETIKLPNDTWNRGVVYNLSWLEDESFELKAIETLDEICKNPIDINNPPTIIMNGTCVWSNGDRVVQFRSSNDWTGRSIEFEACTISS